MSKRRAAEAAPDGKAAGKRRLDSEAQQDLEQDDQLDILLGDGVPDDEGLSAEDFDGDIDAAALEALAAGDDNGDDEGSEAVFDIDDEVGELPDGTTEEQLTEPEEVDLASIELTLPQARRVAQLLAQNEGLTSVRLEGRTLAVGDMKEDDELEWDSEEYTDVDAIILAELLRTNTTVKRLDLARNQIGDAGACALAAVLNENAELEYLNLENNTFGEKAGRAFCGALGVNSTLQYLNLMYNSVPTGVQDTIRERWSSTRESQGVGLHL